MSAGTQSRGAVSEAPAFSDPLAGREHEFLPREEPARISETLGRLGANSLLIAILGPFLALTSPYTTKILLAVVVLDIPLQIGAHLYYRENAARFGALGGLSVSATSIALAGLYLSWLFRTLAKNNSGTRPSLQFSVPLLLYLLISAISILVAQDVALAWFEVALLLEACLVYFYIANTVRTTQDVVYIMALLLLGCLLESTIMILMRFTLPPTTVLGLPIHLHAEGVGHGFLRIGGTIGSSNTSAAYLSISLACAAGVLFTNLGRGYKCLAAAVLALGGVALIFTLSRGGWIALALALTLLCLAVWRRQQFSWKAPILVVSILVLLYLPFRTVISGRLLGDDRGSAESRIPLMNLAFRISQDNPVLGVGANNFTVVMDRYLSPEFRKGFLFAVHNKYLLVLAETGIGGLLAFLAFLLSILYQGWQCWGMEDRLLSPLALGMATGIAGHMVHMTVDVFRGRPTQQLIWLIAGLLAAIYRMYRIPGLSSPGLSSSSAKKT
jgi:O-antigen ligase